MTYHRLLTFSAALAAGAALGVPTAFAGPGPFPVSHPVAPLQVGPDERAPLGIYAPTAAQPGGFAWGDFGIGAGAALGGVLLALGTVTVCRQTGRPAIA